MTKMINFICTLVNGVHARPATHVEKICKQFGSNVCWHNSRSGQKGDGKSVLSLIATDTRIGDACVLEINGEDEDLAFKRLSQFIAEEFPHCDAALSPHLVQKEATPPASSVTRLDSQIVRGYSASAGIARGKLLFIESMDLSRLNDWPATLSPSQEREQLTQGLDKVKKTLDQQISSESGTAAAILETHRALLEDSLFTELFYDALNEGKSSAQAIIGAISEFSAQLEHSSSEYLKERVLDIRDICFRLLQQIYGEQRFPHLQTLNEESICLVEELTPSQFLALDRRYLKGLLLCSGAKNSHTVILARLFNIPTLVGVERSELLPYLQQIVQLDADLSVVAPVLDEKVVSCCQQADSVEPQLHAGAQVDESQQENSLFTTQCISLNQNWRSKEEVINGMVDKLVLAGRCHQPQKLEEAIWEREAIFSTNLGFSFAIPHTKSQHIEQSTISFTKLASPILWGDEPVQFVIMLTLNEQAAGEQHMRIFSRLARKIMHEEFRERLKEVKQVEQVKVLLRQELAI